MIQKDFFNNFNTFPKQKADNQKLRKKSKLPPPKKKRNQNSHILSPILAKSFQTNNLIFTDVTS